MLQPVSKIYVDLDQHKMVLALLLLLMLESATEMEFALIGDVTALAQWNGKPFHVSI